MAQSVGRIEMGSGDSCIENIGFDQGLQYWTLGDVFDSVAVISGDAYATSPFEGSQMLRIGTPTISNAINQPLGLTGVYQNFQICDEDFWIAFNMFTWDYTAFDLFECKIIDTSTNDTLFLFQRGAWGEDTTFKTSGWRKLNIDLTGHSGKNARISYRAGGTRDQLYATWVYVDSYESGDPILDAYDPYFPPPY